MEKFKDASFDLTTTKGYKALTEAIATVRAPRFNAQNVSKASKSELTGISKAIGAEEEAVAKFLEPVESRLVKLKADHDAKVAEEKSIAKEANDARIAKHLARITLIRSYLERANGLPAERIAKSIAALEDLAIEGMEEFT